MTRTHWRAAKRTPDQIRRSEARADGIIDETVVDRLTHGELIWATSAEILAAAIHLNVRGVDCAEIGRLLRLTPRTIERRLAAHRRTLTF